MNQYKMLEAVREALGEGRLQGLDRISVRRGWAGDVFFDFYAKDHDRLRRTRLNR